MSPNREVLLTKNQGNQKVLRPFLKIIDFFLYEMSFDLGDASIVYI